MLHAVVSFINISNKWIWSWPMIILLLGTHIFMTIRTKGIQRKLGTAIKLSVTRDPGAEGEVSQFGALATALASTIGTGNIIGVGTAIALGGPGAVLWCWLTGVFGIATKYSESLIAVKYRVKTKDGRMQGGAMYALERGLHMKWLAILFAFFGAFASFGIGCATQVNAIATVCKANLGIPEWVVGVVDCKSLRETGSVYGSILCSRMYHHSGDQPGLLMARSKNHLYTGIPAWCSSRRTGRKRNYDGNALWNCKRTVFQ